MVTIKIILDTRRVKQDGTYPIMFRITNDRQSHYLKFGLSIKTTQWDFKTCQLNKQHPNAQTINTSLSKRFHELQKKVLSFEDSQEYSIDALKQSLIPKKKTIENPVTFAVFSNQVVAEFMELKRTGNALVYKTAINRLIVFNGNRDLSFKEIDYQLLDRFKTTLLKDGLKLNSVGNYLRSIRALYNKAIRAKLVSRELYPFNDISIKVEKTTKRAISTNDMSIIYKAIITEQSPEWHARNYFLLSFMLRGMSFTDMAYLKPESVLNNTLRYRRRKTKKLYNIGVHPEALKILNFYSSTSKRYLLPIIPVGVEEDGIEVKKITRQWIKTTNRYLRILAARCKLNCEITTYVARHTWATIAKRLGYSNELIAEALGHEYGNKITNIYLDSFDQNLIDEANCKVVGCLI